MYIPQVVSTLYHMEWVRAEAIRHTKLAILGEAVIDDDLGFDYRSNFSPFRVSVIGLWMLSNDFDPVSNSRSEGFLQRLDCPPQCDWSHSSKS